MKNKYDLIFSIGEACSCTGALRSSGLQFTSYPMDWLFGANFKTRIYILLSEFERFIDKKDLVYAYSERSIKCDAYHNKYNDLIFNHDFPAGIKLAKSYYDIKEKYNRRISRLLNNIEKADSILVVYIETPNCKNKTPDNQIVTTFNKIVEKYKNKKIDLLYLSNNNDIKSINTNILTNHITKIVSNYKSKKENDLPYVVNNDVLLKVFNNYSLDTSFRFKKIIFLCSFFIKLIPIKSYRKQLKEKYHA